MWELYHLLVQDSPTGDLMEDVHRILEHTPPVYIDTAMHLLYDDTVSISDGMTLLVIKAGLQACHREERVVGRVAGEESLDSSRYGGRL